MVSEKTRIERESPWPHQGDRGGHDYQFEKGQRTVRRVPGDDRDLGKSHYQTEDCNRDTCNRSEESNQKAGAAASKQEARGKDGKRPIAIMDYVQNALRGGRDADHRS
jgi:hypothetical protein